MYDGGAEPQESLVASVEFAERLATTKSVSVWKPIQLAVDPLSVYLFDRETRLRLDGLQRVRISANHAGSRVGRPPLVVQPCTVTPVA